MKTALIVVDVQNDFCRGGSLAVPDAESVIPALNDYARRFAEKELPVFATRDWHPRQTRHFREFGGLWPPHCVQGTLGAEFHPDLRLPVGTTIVSTGTGPADEGYSGFEGATPEGISLAEALRAKNVGRVCVGGLATDYCVRATVLAAVELGFAATFLIDGSRAVNVRPGDAERAIVDMLRAGADLTIRERLSL